MPFERLLRPSRRISIANADKCPECRRLCQPHAEALALEEVFGINRQSGLERENSTEALRRQVGC